MRVLVGAQQQVAQVEVGVPVGRLVHIEVDQQRAAPRDARPPDRAPRSPRAAPPRRASRPRRCGRRAASRCRAACGGAAPCRADRPRCPTPSRGSGRRARHRVRARRLQLGQEALLGGHLTRGRRRVALHEDCAGPPSLPDSPSSASLAQLAGQHRGGVSGDEDPVALGPHVERRAAPGELMGDQARRDPARPPSTGRPRIGPTPWQGPRRSPRWGRRRAARSRHRLRRGGRGQEQRLGPGRPRWPPGRARRCAPHRRRRGPRRRRSRCARWPRRHRAIGPARSRAAGPGSIGSAGKSSSMRVAVERGPQGAAPRVKGQRRRPVDDAVLTQRVRRGEGGVAAQVDLDRRREPAQTEDGRDRRWG